MKYSIFALCLAAIAASSPKSSAVLVVDWGGDYVTTSTALQAGGYVAGEPQILSPASGYSGTSGTFYGATAITGTRTRDNLIQQNSTSDRIQMKTSDAGTGVGAFLVLWEQANFLGGLDTGNVAFGTGDQVSVQVATLANFSAGRLVLRQGTSYYISDALLSSVSTFNLTPASLNWYNYDPTGWNAADASTLNTVGTAASIVSDGQIQNVTEIGFLFSSLDNSGNAARVQNFEVNLTAVPETGSLALILPLAGTMVFIRRRRSNFQA